MTKWRFVLLLVMFTGLPAAASVWGGPDQDMMPGAIGGVQRKCLDCHRSRNLNTNEGVLSSNAFCYECHADEACRRQSGEPVSLRVTPKSFERARHECVACVQCHTDVAGSRHLSSMGVHCLGCHEAHGEETAHDPHVAVRCEACHTDSPFVEREKDTGKIRLARLDDKGVPLSFTEHRMTEVRNEEFCKRCHYAGNRVGAAATVLPSKSVLCIVCHAAPLGKIGHWMFWAALSVGMLGFIGTAAFWFQGRVEGEEDSTHRKIAAGSDAVWQAIFSRRIFSALRTLFYDVLLQRRILQESVRRWSIHSLIFFGFIGRLILSLISNALRGSSPAWLDKNYWLSAFLNDFLGLLILLGVIWAAILRLWLKPRHVLSEEQDNVGLIFIGLLVSTGFLLEGARILTTMVPSGVAVYSFMGYLVSRFLLLFGSGWQGAYPYLWYLHAALWALFIAYLPFGKFRHVVTTPLTLIVRGSGGK